MSKESSYLFMSTQRGNFSKGFLALHLQLRTLFEEAGGEEMLGLLDLLAQMNRSEQDIIVKSCRRIIEQLVKNGDRIETPSDKSMKEFEENLYKEVLVGMREASTCELPRKLEVLPGGKEKVVSLRSPASLKICSFPSKDKKNGIFN